MQEGKIRYQRNCSCPSKSFISVGGKGLDLGSQGRESIACGDQGEARKDVWEKRKGPGSVNILGNANTDF